MKWLLQGGRVLDPARGASAEADVLVDGSRIAAVGRDLPADGATVRDARGLVVAPGFVDMHVHLREPGQTEQETIESGARAAVRGGFVAVAAMPNTRPPVDSPELVEQVARRGREAGLARIYPIACITRGQAGQELTDFAALQAAGAIAFSDDGRCVMDAGLMRAALERARAHDLLLIGHEEDHRLTAGGCAHEGAHATAAGLAGMPALAEDVVVARDLLLAEATGARVHVAHVSSARAVALIRDAKRRGVRVTAEVTPHHLLLTDAALAARDANFKMNPPLRTEEDRQALVAGLADGTIDAIATDHAPHTRAEKVDFASAAFGVIGLETAVPVVLTRLLGQVPLERLVDAFATRPARILGLGDLGSVAPGAAACLTVLDLDATDTIDPERFASRSRNTPFGGWEVRGLPVLTVVDGRVVMDRAKAAAPWAS